MTIGRSESFEEDVIPVVMMTVVKSIKRRKRRRVTPFAGPGRALSASMTRRGWSDLSLRQRRGEGSEEQGAQRVFPGT